VSRDRTRKQGQCVSSGVGNWGDVDDSLGPAVVDQSCGVQRGTLEASSQKEKLQKPPGLQKILGCTGARRAGLGREVQRPRGEAEKPGLRLCHGGSVSSSRGRGWYQ
jgi:hypothetical protein